MDITVLGCGAAYPRPGGACSGFLVRGTEGNVWLDAGNGTFSRLQQHISGHDIDAVVLSHVHADHIADFLPFMYFLGYHTELPPAPIPVYTTDEVVKMAQMSVGRGSQDIFKQVMEFRPINEPFEVKDLRFDAFRTEHPPETFGVRVSSNGHAAVYTSDTAKFDELPEACRDADLLIAEATYVQGMESNPGIHMWASETGEVAHQAGVGRLILTHIWPSASPEQATSEAAQTFSGDLTAAVEGQRYTL